MSACNKLILLGWIGGFCTYGFMHNFSIYLKAHSEIARWRRKK